MAGMGEKMLMGIHEAFNAVSRSIERRGKLRDLVFALYGNARAEIAFAKFRDAGLQLFQAARELADQGIESHRDGERQPKQGRWKTQAVNKVKAPFSGTATSLRPSFKVRPKTPPGACQIRPRCSWLRIAGVISCVPPALAIISPASDNKARSKPLLSLQNASSEASALAIAVGRQEALGYVGGRLRPGSGGRSSNSRSSPAVIPASTAKTARLAKSAR